MAPEVIACDENPDATYDNRVSDHGGICDREKGSINLSNE